MLSLLLLSSAHAVTLEEAWAAAEKNGVDRALVREVTVQAETARGKAWALVQPKVVAGANYTINEKEIAVDFGAMMIESLPEEFAAFIPEDYESEPAVVQQKEYWDWNVSVVQPLFDAAAVPTIRAAHLGAQAARETERAADIEIKLGVAQAYWGVVVARDAVRIAEQALQNAQQHRKLAEVQVAAGTAAPTAKLQGDLASARAERELRAAKEGEAVAAFALSRLTGLPLDTPVETPATPNLPEGNQLPSIVGRAMNAHPSTAAAVAQEKAARMMGVASHLRWLPTVDGRFTYAYTGNTGLLNDDPTLWMVVFSANWTLWDGGFRVASEREATSQARAAALAATRTRLDLEQRVRAQWERLERARASLATVEREETLAGENLRIAEAAFEAGTITWLDLEYARLGLEAARLAHLQQRMDHDLAAMELIAAREGAL